MKRLIFHLMDIWFGMIKAEEKPEEYREMKSYYHSRFLDCKRLLTDYHEAGYNGNIDDAIEMAIRRGNKDEIIEKYGKKFDEVEFCIAYPPKEDTSRRLVFSNPKIKIDFGNSKWGAKPNKLYYVITWYRTK